jgi:acetyl esterase/lipase
LEAYNSPAAEYAPTVVIDFSGSMYGTQGTIQAGAPPAFIAHGDADTTVPYADDQAIASQLTSVGVYNAFYDEPGVGHAIDLTQIDGTGNTLLQDNMNFLGSEFLEPVPEPSTLALAGIACGVFLLSFARRRPAAA